MIYSGFYSGDDKRALRNFQECDWAQRAEIVEGLTDERLKQLGRRIIYSNAPYLLPEKYLKNADKQIKARWLSNDPKSPWTTLAAVEQQLNEIGEREIVSQETLSDLHRFYKSRMSDIGQLS